MSSTQGTVDFILEQMAGAGAVSARKMFGEYGLYRAGTMFGLVCDDQLFIKPTAQGRSLLGDDAIEASPYPGAKPCFLIPVALWEDGDRLAELVRITAAGLPGAVVKTAHRSDTKGGGAGSVRNS